MEAKFYRCSVCGKIIQIINDTNVPTICCGKEMELLKAGTVDAVVEKHVPSVEVEENHVKIRVGEVDHPMAEEHYIQWIALQTKYGLYIKKLKPTDEPKTCFKICKNDSVVDVYAYCNLHGLWKN